MTTIVDRPLHTPTHHRPSRGTELTVYVLGALLVAAAVAGLLVPDVYVGPAATAETFRAWDLVTVPTALLLVLAARRARNGDTVAHVIVVGLVASVVYTYAYYLFGTGFNDLFLLHVVVFGTGLGALVLTFRELDVAATSARFDDRARHRLAAGLLAALAAGLGGMWVWAALDNAVNGAVPEGSVLVETETVVRLGMVLDLALLVPLYSVAAVLLWRRAAWGLVLGLVAVVAGLVHQVAYLAAMPFQVAAGVSGAVATDPAEPLVVLVYLAAGWAILRGLSREERPAAAPTTSSSA